MPWKSDAQRRWGNSPAGHAALGDKGVAEWNSASRGKHLPKRANTGGNMKRSIDGALRTAKKYASGGGMDTWMMHQASRNLHQEGMIRSSVPGRTDKLPMNVPSGSYVLPADIPSALGQGNTMAGGKILQKMFNSGPGGMPLPKIGGGRPNMPRLNLNPQRIPKSPFADGGDVPNPTDQTAPTDNPSGPFGQAASDRREWDAMKARQQRSFGPTGRESIDAQGKVHGMASGGKPNTVPIIAAGGEFTISPEVVKDIGHGDINAGHRVLDSFVLHVRKEHIKTLKGLKPPKK